MKNTENSVSELLDFKIFWRRRNAPRPPTPTFASSMSKVWSQPYLLRGTGKVTVIVTVMVHVTMTVAVNVTAIVMVTVTVNVRVIVAASVLQLYYSQVFSERDH